MDKKTSTQLIKNAQHWLLANADLQTLPAVKITIKPTQKNKNCSVSTKNMAVVITLFLSLMLNIAVIAGTNVLIAPLIFLIALCVIYIWYFPNKMTIYYQTTTDSDKRDLTVTATIIQSYVRLIKLRKSFYAILMLPKLIVDGVAVYSTKLYYESVGKTLYYPESKKNKSQIEAYTCYDAYMIQHGIKKNVLTTLLDLPFPKLLI